MEFSEKQKQVTRQCIESENIDYWLIGSEGMRIRPSNWPERIASTFMEQQEFTQHRKIISECVGQTFHNGRNCLRVRKAFQMGCNQGWFYILSFAETNGLSIIDNHGQAYSDAAVADMESF